jgi:hypothetical protein
MLSKKDNNKNRQIKDKIKIKMNKEQDNINKIKFYKMNNK